MNLGHVFAQGDIVLITVFLLLLLMSVLTWWIIIMRSFRLHQVRHANRGTIEAVATVASLDEVLRLAKAQTVEQFGCAGLGRGATGVDPVGVGFAHGLAVAVGLGLPDGGFCGDQGGIGVHHEANGVDAGLGRMLGQPGDAQLRQVDIALFGREITAQQGQQRAFAAAVGADEGHALTGVDDERGVAE